jgi:hypothetical protein
MSNEVLCLEKLLEKHKIKKTMKNMKTKKEKTKS